MAANPESSANPHTSASSQPYPPLTGKRRKWPLLLLLLAFVLLTAYIIYRQHAAPHMDQPKGGRRGMGGMPTTVSVGKATARDVNVYMDALGTITPRNNVIVRSRVDGQLLQLYFKEGQMVKAGELLAQIDPKPYEAQLAQVSGQLARDQALLENALIDAERYNTLLAQDSISRQQVDTQASLVRQYRGAVEVDRAQVENAKLQLSYARITAPLSGRVGLRQVDPGNMIRTSDANGIVTITQLQPITALFNIPEDNLAVILKRMKSGTPVIVEAYDRSQQNKLATGTLLTVDNQIDTTTGTVRLRAQFDNKDNALFPNQFVNIKILVDVEKDATVVPVTALQHGRNGDFVYVMQRGAPTDAANGEGQPHTGKPGTPPASSEPAPPADNAKPEGKPAEIGNASNAGGQPHSNGGPVREVRMTPVTLGHVDGDVTSILSGLKPGDVVVTDGADKLKDGAKIRPVFARTDAGKQPGSRGKKHSNAPGAGLGVSGPGSTDSAVTPSTAPAGAENAGRPGAFQHGGHRQRSAE